MINSFDQMYVCKKYIYDLDDKDLLQVLICSIKSCIKYIALPRVVCLNEYGCSKLVICSSQNKCKCFK